MANTGMRLYMIGSLEPIFEKFLFDTSICCLYEDICEPDYGLCFSSVFCIYDVVFMMLYL